MSAAGAVRAGAPVALAAPQERTGATPAGRPLLRSRASARRYSASSVGVRSTNSMIARWPASPRRGFESFRMRV